MRDSTTVGQPEIRSRLRAIRLPLLIVLGTLVIIFLLMATRPRMQPIPTSERVWPVDVIEAHYGTVQPELNLFGEVAAGRRSELRPLVSGLIIEIGPNFHDGGIVQKDELLVQIDPFDYETALAEQRSILKEAQARLQMLRKDYERAIELRKDNTVSEQFLENAELELVQQEAVVEQREISVTQAKRDLRETRLLAPYDGVVNNVSANLGNQVSGFGNDKVADLIDMSRLEVRFSLSNAQYGRLLESSEPVVGRPVQVSWQVGNEKMTYEARIERVGAEIVSTTGGVEVYAVIQSSENQANLRPGAFVAVIVSDKAYRNVVRAPESAIYGENVIYVIEDERLAERRIDIRGYDGANILFKSAADPPVEEGDLIVTTQLREGGSGAKVEVR
jgi:RND family efflux transporter MFP subunit